MLTSWVGEASELLKWCAFACGSTHLHYISDPKSKPWVLWFPRISWCFSWETFISHASPSVSNCAHQRSKHNVVFDNLSTLHDSRVRPRHARLWKHFQTTPCTDGKHIHMSVILTPPRTPSDTIATTLTTLARPVEARLSSSSSSAFLSGLYEESAA